MICFVVAPQIFSERLRHENSLNLMERCHQLELLSDYSKMHGVAEIFMHFFVLWQRDGKVTGLCVHLSHTSLC